MMTAERVRELLSYDHETGILRWRVHRSPKTRAGAVAGRLTFLGYRQIKLDYKPYFSHRLAWLHVYGTWPSGEIDHIDGDRKNNAIANLRDVSRSQNNANRRTVQGSLSKFKGVSWSKREAKWQASITSGRKAKWLGYFPTEQDAAAAYDEAAVALFGEYAAPNSSGLSAAGSAIRWRKASKALPGRPDMGRTMVAA